MQNLDSNTLAKLCVKLNEKDLNTLNKIITQVDLLKNLSAKELLQQLITEGINAPIFTGIASYLSAVESNCPVTYDDSSGCNSPYPPFVAFNTNNSALDNGFMTIGIGLNIADDNAEALFHALDPNRDWHFSQMQSHTGLPEPALKLEQTQKLLYYTLIGADYPEKKLHYPGQIPMLITKLGVLADTPFTPYQLIALLSLSYNSPALIGGGLLNALTELPTKGPMNALIEILEWSNKDLIIGHANRRLKDAALFYGKPAEVAIPMREIQKLLAKNPGRDLDNGPALYPLPILDLHKSFIGGQQEIIEPGRDKSNDDIYYGTFKPDTFPSLSAGSKVILGGEKNDKLFIADSEYPYLAGNDGDDTYTIGEDASKVMIYDTDNLGELIIKDKTVEGIAVAKSDTRFTLTTKDTAYTLDYDKDDKDALPKLTWGDADNDVTLANFKGGQFNIAPLYQTHKLTDIKTSSESFFNLADGRIVQHSIASQPDDSCELTLNYFSSQGQKQKTVTLKLGVQGKGLIFPSPVASGLQLKRKHPQKAEDGDLVFSWLYFKDKPYTIENIVYGGIITSSEGVLKYNLAFPEPRDKFLRRDAFAQLISLSEGNFVHIIPAFAKNEFANTATFILGNVFSNTGALLTDSAIIAHYPAGIEDFYCSPTSLNGFICAANVYQVHEATIDEFNALGAKIKSYPLQNNIAALAGLDKGFLAVCGRTPVVGRTQYYSVIYSLQTAAWTKPLILLDNVPGTGNWNAIPLNNNNALITYGNSDLKAFMLRGDNEKMGETITLTKKAPSAFTGIFQASKLSGNDTLISWLESSFLRSTLYSRYLASDKLREPPTPVPVATIQPPQPPVSSASQTLPLGYQTVNDLVSYFQPQTQRNDKSSDSSFAPSRIKAPARTSGYGQVVLAAALIHMAKSSVNLAYHWWHGLNQSPEATLCSEQLNKSLQKLTVLAARQKTALKILGKNVKNYNQAQQLFLEGLQLALDNHWEELEQINQQGEATIEQLTELKANLQTLDEDISELQADIQVTKLCSMSGIFKVASKNSCFITAPSCPAINADTAAHQEDLLPEPVTTLAIR